MIVAMKKVAVITQGKDKLSALDKLRSLGLFHVQHTQPPKGKDIGVLNEQIALVSQALSVLPDASAKVVFDTPMADWQFITRHIIDLYKRKDQLGQYLQGGVEHPFTRSIEVIAVNKSKHRVDLQRLGYRGL